MPDDKTIDLSVLKPFLDQEGRLTQYPAKRGRQLVALEYLASKFVIGKRYSEKEINELLAQWHTFKDWAMLRRDLVDSGLISREGGGGPYWREEKKPD